MKKAIDTEIDSLAKKWSSDALTIDVDYFFIPLEVYEDSEFTEPAMILTLKNANTPMVPRRITVPY